MDNLYDRGDESTLRDTYEKADDIVHAFGRGIETVFREAVGRGSWQSGIHLLVTRGYFTEADISKSLGVTRSSVNRWLSGRTAPQSNAMPALRDEICKMIHARERSNVMLAA